MFQNLIEPSERFVNRTLFKKYDCVGQIKNNRMAVPTVNAMEKPNGVCEISSRQLNIALVEGRPPRMWKVDGLCKILYILKQWLSLC